MTVTADPVLTVAGQPVGLAGPGLVGVDALTVGWGRDSVLSRPAPASLAVTVLDRSTGYAFARRTDLIGQPVLLSYTAADGAASASGVMFRGWVDGVTVDYRPGKGMFVGLSATSREVEAANYPVPAGTTSNYPRTGQTTVSTLPAQSFSARRNALLSLLPPLFFPGGAVLPTRADIGLTNVADPALDLADYTAAPMDIAGASPLDLLRQLYDSMAPTPMVYDPAADRLTFAPLRRYLYNNAAAAVLVAALVPGAGGYVPAPLAAGALPLDGDEVGHDGPVVQPIDARITQVQVNYSNAAASYAAATAVARTTEAAAGAEATIGARALTVDSIHAATDYAGQLGLLYADVASGEARAFRLDTLSWDTARRPFPSLAHAAALLTPYETAAQFFIRGSWLPRLDTRPVFGILGGRLIYARGAWRVEFTPAPVRVDAPAPAPLPIRYAATAGVRLVDVDRHTTFGDLRYVQIGAGYTAATQPPWGT